MKTHLVLLRGINVSGQKLIKMELLRQYLGEAGFEKVRTYIQSGNVILESNLTPDKVKDIVNKIILDKFGFDVGIVVLNETDLVKAVADNPFRNQVDPVRKAYIAFLSEMPSAENIRLWETMGHGDDKTKVDEKVVYVLYDESAGKSKLTNVLIEKRLKVVSTMRNLNTAEKLLEMLRAEI